MPANKITLTDLTLRPLTFGDGTLKGMQMLGPDNVDLGVLNFSGKRWSYNGEEFRGIRRPMERAVKAFNDALAPKLINVEDFLSYPNDTRPSVTLKVGADDIAVTGFLRSPAPIITDLDDPEGEQFDARLDLADGRTVYVDFDTQLTIVPNAPVSTTVSQNPASVDTSHGGGSIW